MGSFLFQSDRFLRVAAPAGIASASSVTLIVWVKPTASAQDSSWIAAGDGTQGPRVRMENNFGNAIGGATSGPTYSSVYLSAQYASAWLPVVLEVTETTLSVSGPAETQSLPSITATTVESGVLYIGSRADALGATQGPINCPDGYISLACWVPRTLTSGERAELLTGGAGGIPKDPRACTWWATSGAVIWSGDSDELALRDVSGSSVGTFVVRNASDDSAATSAGMFQTDTPPVDGGSPQVPGKPDAIAFTAPGQAALFGTWTLPSAGSSAIDSLELRATGTGGQTATLAADAVSGWVAGLTNAQAYTLAVRAHNAEGWGAWSDESSSVTPQALSAPASPTASETSVTHTTIVAGSTSAATSGTQVVHERRYERRLNGSGNPWTASSVERVTDGVAIGTAYTFQGLQPSEAWDWRVVDVNWTDHTDPGGSEQATASNVVTSTTSAVSSGIVPITPGRLPSAGAPWTADTTEPGEIGQGEYASWRPVRSWHWYPYETHASGTVYVGVFGVHQEGIDFVRFGLNQPGANADDLAAWVDVYEISQDPVSGVWGWFVSVDVDALPADGTADGRYEMRAIVYPKTGQPSFVEFDYVASGVESIGNDFDAGGRREKFFGFHLNPGGTLSSTVIDAATFTGTYGSNIAAAVAAAGEGGTVQLPEGYSYQIPDLGSVTTPNDRFVTIEAAPGVKPWECVFTSRAGSTGGNCFVRYRGVKVVYTPSMTAHIFNSRDGQANGMLVLEDFHFDGNNHGSEAHAFLVLNRAVNFGSDMAPPISTGNGGSCQRGLWHIRNYVVEASYFFRYCTGRRFCVSNGMRDDVFRDEVPNDFGSMYRYGNLGDHSDTWQFYQECSVPQENIAVFHVGFVLNSADQQMWYLTHSQEIWDTFGTVNCLYWRPPGFCHDDPEFNPGGGGWTEGGTGVHQTSRHYVWLQNTVINCPTTIHSSPNDTSIVDGIFHACSLHGLLSETGGPQSGNTHIRTSDLHQLHPGGGAIYPGTLNWGGITDADDTFTSAGFGPSNGEPDGSPGVVPSPSNTSNGVYLAPDLAWQDGVTHDSSAAAPIFVPNLTNQEIEDLFDPTDPDRFAPLFNGLDFRPIVGGPIDRTARREAPSGASWPVDMLGRPRAASTARGALISTAEAPAATTSLIVTADGQGIADDGTTTYPAAFLVGASVDVSLVATASGGDVATSSPTLTGDFDVSSDVSAITGIISEGASESGTLTLDTSSPGSKSATFSIGTDSSLGQFVHQFDYTVSAAAPPVFTVSVDTQLVSSGETGVVEVVAPGTKVTVTIEVENGAGEPDLTVTALNLPTNWVDESGDAYGATIIGGATWSRVVSVTPGEAGSYSGTIEIVHTGAHGSPPVETDFLVEAEVLAVALQGSVTGWIPTYRRRQQNLVSYDPIVEDAPDAVIDLDDLAYTYETAAVRSSSFYNVQGSGADPVPDTSEAGVAWETLTNGHRATRVYGSWVKVNSATSNTVTFPLGSGNYATNQSTFVNGFSANWYKTLCKKAADIGDIVYFNITGIPNYLSARQGDFGNAGDIPNFARSVPADETAYVAWEDLVKAIITSLIDINGVPVSKLRVSMWNEPDAGLFLGSSDLVTGTAREDEFVELYRRTMQAVRSVNSSIKCGGCESKTHTGQIATGTEPILQRLIDDAISNAWPFDFIVWHELLYTPSTFAGEMTTVRGWVTSAGGDPDAYEYSLGEVQMPSFGSPNTAPSGPSAPNTRDQPYAGLLYALSRIHAARDGFIAHCWAAWEDWGSLSDPPDAEDYPDFGGWGLWQVIDASSDVAKPWYPVHTRLDDVGQLDELAIPYFDETDATAPAIIVGRSGGTYRVMATAQVDWSFRIVSNGTPISVTTSTKTTNPGGESSMTLVDGAESMVVDLDANDVAYLEFAAVSSTVGDVVLPPIAVTAAGSVAAVGDGALTLPTLGVAATGSAAFGGDAAIVLPSLEAAGDGRLTVTGASSITLPSLEVAAAGALPIAGDAVVTLPALIAEGRSLQSLIVLPAVEVTGSGAVEVLGAGALTLPVLEVTSDGRAVLSGVGSLTLPSFDVASSGTVPTPSGDGLVLLPAVSLAGSGRLGLGGSGAILLPALTVFGSSGSALSSVVEVEVWVTGDKVFELTV